MICSTKVVGFPEKLMLMLVAQIGQVAASGDADGHK